MIATPHRRYAAGRYGRQRHQGGTALGRPLALRPGRAAHRGPPLYGLQPGQALHHAEPGPARIRPPCVRRLTEQADVVLANNRPDVAGRLGIDYDTLAAINPAIIYCEGLGIRASRAGCLPSGYDIIIQAMSGIAPQRGQSSQWRPPAHRRQPAGGFGVRFGPGVGGLRGIVRQRAQRRRGGRSWKLPAGNRPADAGDSRFVRIDAIDREPHAQIRESIGRHARRRHARIPNCCPSMRRSISSRRVTSTIGFTRPPDGMLVVGCLNAGFAPKAAGGNRPPRHPL